MESTEKPPKRSILWVCPTCENRIILHVRVAHSPTCHNPASQSSKVVEMVRKKIVE
jgi:hypothetical protein